MSSKRGRKRNDNLPPNRARDVQRAFRARRAAHLDALEQRVAELEEENNTLRAALSLPPANRPALGKGPTGKDKPKPYAPRPPSLSALSPSEPIASGSSLPSANTLAHLVLPPASRTESPSSNSTRTHSLSPSSITAVLNTSTQPPGMSDSSAWDDGVFAARDRADPSPVSNSYPVTPVSTTASQAPYPFPSSAASSSRQSVGGGQTYSLQISQNYPHTADRPTGEAYSDSLFDRRYSFTQSAYPSAAHDTSHTTFHAQSPTSAVSLPPHRGSANVQNSMSFAHRRSITEPQALRSALMNSLPTMMHQQQAHSHAPRGPSPPNMTETVGHLRAAEFDVDPRVNQMNTLPS